MRFSTREDIAAPAGFVFATITDVAELERRAGALGVQAQRAFDGPLAVGATWHITAKVRGKHRQITATVIRLTPDEDVTVESRFEGLNTVTQVDIVPLNPKTTRLIVKIDLLPQSTRARLLVQSMRLVKPRLNRQFKTRVLHYAEDIALSYLRR